MASVELTATAVEDLNLLIRSHSLPPDTKARLSRTLRALQAFPLLGASLTERWSGMRFLLGPWRWMIVVYVYIESEERVVVLTIQDGRSSSFA